MIYRTFAAIALAASAALASAQKIDFDMTGRQTKEVTEDGCQSWAVPKCKADTMRIGVGPTDSIDVTVTCGDISATDRTLRANWSKNIVQQSSKLVGDAVVVYGLDDDGNTPHLTTESATVSFTFSGFKAGAHSLLAYLNVTDGGMTTMAPIDVLVDGKTVLSGVNMTWQATSPSASGQAYITFDAVDGRDVTVSFTSKPVAGETYSTSGVYVNGLVIDQPNPKTTALDPSPAHLDLHADADGGSVKLSWTAAECAVKHIIYIGTAADGMQNIGETAKAEYTVSGLTTHQTYYWRVDEVDSDGNVYSGETWTFRPRRLAFPSAEGYGRYAIGGRGGSVYHVTSLGDYADGDTPQPGTLRYGVKEIGGPRTIVFDVAGTIHLKDRLTCSDAYVSVAGQTAPGHGVLLRGAPFGMADDGVTRFIRVRRGFHNDDEADMDKGLDGLGMAGGNHAIMDHCSVGWTIDEAFSSRNAKNITLQRTLISEALNSANHPNYSSGKLHGFAATIGGDTGTYHHNLLAHNEGRNWSLSGGLDGTGAYAGRHDIFNNVVYNWGGRATDGGTHECNFVNNYYKMGQATSQKALLNAQLEGTGTGSQSYYVSGNIRENKDGSLTDDKKGDTYKYTTSGGQQVDWTVFVSNPFFESYADIEPARLAFKTVLSDVGANQPYFDEHDARMVSETLNGTYTCTGSKTGKKGLIDRETDSEGFTYFYEAGETRAADFDTDQDGMPDWWEQLKGRNPSVADNNAYEEAFGYTALEQYLNWIAEPNFTVKAGVENTVVSLQTLFAGFNNDASYSVSAPTGYSAKADGGNLVVTPPSDANALATITVTAEDSDNVGAMTRNVNLRITSDASVITTPFVIDDDFNGESQIYTAGGVLVRSATGINSLPSGLYILRTKSGDAVRTAKILVR